MKHSKYVVAVRRLLLSIEQKIVRDLSHESFRKLTWAEVAGRACGCIILGVVDT